MRHVYHVSWSIRDCIILGYICSKCKNARTVSIDTKIGEYTSISHLQDDNIFPTICSTIESRTREQKSIVSSFGVSGKVIGKRPTLYTVELVGVRSACCPLCGNQEAWQKQCVTDSEFEQMKEESFPLAWYSPQDVESWLNKFAEKKQEELNREWRRNPPSYSELKNRKKQYEEDIEQLEKKISEIPERARYIELSKRKEELESHKGEGSIFSAERRQRERELRKIGEEMERLKTQYSITGKEFIKALVKNKNELDEFIRLYQGLDGNLISIEDGRNVCWYLD